LFLTERLVAGTITIASSIRVDDASKSNDKYKKRNTKDTTMIMTMAMIENIMTDPKFQGGIMSQINDQDNNILTLISSYENHTHNNNISFTMEFLISREVHI
jgi:hypothetical protein